MTYQSTDWNTYRMVYSRPHDAIEPLQQERAMVHEALTTLSDADILAHTDYDERKFLDHRRAIAQRFEIPWTAITPRMQRLLYAVNAIRQPRRMVAAGIFCGNTFISSAGAAVGPGACYEADDLVGIEIKAEEAVRAERNVRRIDEGGTARIVTADAVTFVTDYSWPIDLLYLDADGDAGRGKAIYLEILQACYDRLPAGSLVLAHNSVNAATRLAEYLAFVRDPARFQASVNIVFDIEGLEVSRR